MGATTDKIKGATNEAIGKAKELQARIWFTLIALIVYRIGTQVPIPGIDTAVYAAKAAGRGNAQVSANLWTSPQTGRKAYLGATSAKPIL